MRKILTSLAASVVLIGLTSAPAVAKPTYSVTLTVPSSGDVNNRLPVSGKVSPGGGTIRIYAKDESSSSYVYAGSAAVSSSTGKYSTTIELEEAGLTSIKVVRLASSSRAQKSVAKTVRVYGWIELTDLPLVTQEGASAQDSEWRYGNGNAFYSALLMYRTGGNNAKVRVDLSSRCSKLDGRIGVDDRSSADAQATQRIYSLTSGGTTLTSTAQTTIGRYDYLEPELKLYKKSSSGKITFARYVKVATVLNGTTMLFGANLEAYCFKPGIYNDH